jgi:hypothetical protein
MGVCEEKRHLEESSHSERTPLLEAFTRERLVKAQQAGKYLACFVVICKSDGPVIACGYELCV